MFFLPIAEYATLLLVKLKEFTMKAKNNSHSGPPLPLGSAPPLEGGTDKAPGLGGEGGVEPQYRQKLPKGVLAWCQCYVCYKKVPFCRIKAHQRISHPPSQN